MIKFNIREQLAAAAMLKKVYVQQALDKVEEESVCDIHGTEVAQEEDLEDGDEDELQVDELIMAPSQMDDGAHEVQDPLEEVDLGSQGDPRIAYISALLSGEFKQKLIYLLKEFKDCFAWDYDDMPGLDRSLVEHRLPIKEDFKPFKQPPRRMSKEIELKVKEEIEKLLRAKFIKPIRYTEWLSNIVPVMKKNGKIRVCVDFRDLNCATPKDVYVMPITDMLIDSVAKHELLSFMDGFSGYNQIKIAEADTAKTAFRCPGAIGTFEWLVMPFGLKNAGATYQRAMNSIFHDMIGHHLEVYIDDIVVKSKQAEDHIEHLRKSFQRMRQYELKLNPQKCAFGVKAGNFLGFLVHHRGVEVDKNKAKAIMEASPPKNKKELQRFLGQVNYLRRFISNLAGKTREFSQLLKLKDTEEFRWEPIHQEAFDKIKEYMSKPPVIVPPRYGAPLKLYISAAHESIGCLLVQNNHEGNEQAIYYLSRLLTPTEIKYSVIEKLCLTLYFACTKLRHYLIRSRVHVVAKTDLIKYMLNRPVLSGRIGKWSLALAEFTLLYFPQKSMKGQAVADFLADHPSADPIEEEPFDISVCEAGIQSWELKFDGSSTETSAGAGIVITSPKGIKTALSFNLNFQCTNNQAEYEGLVIGLEILKDLGAKDVLIKGDSQLVLRQLSGEYKCTSISLAPYYTAASQLLDDFEEVSFIHVPRQDNWEANELAQIASGLRMSTDLTHKMVLIQKRSHPSILQRGIQVDTFNLNIDLAGDWRTEIREVLESPEKSFPYGLKMKALNFILVEGELYRKGFDGLLLKCVGFPESLEILKQVHEGVCGAHQSGVKMRWLIRRYGYYWPSILKDCIKYSKGCQPCQKHGYIQRMPADELHSIIKPWPFRGWAMDLIGKIYPPSSKGHSFILVATDFFTKWIEAVPLKKAEQKDVIDFVKENIIHRFGIPESITTDQGTMFTGSEMRAFAEDYGIKLLNSSPHYPQSNGQAEASNKVVIRILQRMMEDNPRDWPRLLSETLWAYRTSRRSATGLSPFTLTFGHEAVLPLEIMVPSLRIARQNELSPEQYTEAMILELEAMDELRLQALDATILQKQVVANSYNKRVRRKVFHEGEIVWKTILPVGTKDRELGKWSPYWEGPFKVHKVLDGNAYWLSSLEGQPHKRCINGRYLKPYFPSIRETYEKEHEQ